MEDKYKRYLLGLLMTILAFNYVDRVALGVMMQSIKIDLQLTDTELGLLTGIAFAFFYSVMGIPIARWADRGNRITIISVTTALWSLAVGLCALARSFSQPLCCRMSVAVGEAGCIPPAHSLIADHFSRAERPRAAARYMLGAPLAMIIGLFVGGWLNALFGWRVTFMVMGLPGIALGALAALTLKEPRLGGHDVSPGQSTASFAATDKPGSLRQIIGALWRTQAFRHLLFCYSVWYFFATGLGQWQPTFFMRSHGLSSQAVGTWLAVVNGVATFLGIYWGGEWFSRHAANQERRQLRAVMGIALFYITCNAIAMWVPSYQMAFGILFVGSAVGNMSQGPILAAMQSLVPSRRRAIAFALVYFFANLVGAGLGPLAVGSLSDALHPWAGEESLRYALLAFCPGYIWFAWHIWRASCTVEPDIAAAQAMELDEVPT